MKPRVLKTALLLSKAKIFFAATKHANNKPKHHMSTIPMSEHYFNNPIKILQRLKAAGFTESQAEAQVEMFSDYIEHGLATKRDLRELEVRSNANLELKLKELELKITIKTAAIVGSIVGFFSLLEKFF